MQSIRIFFTWGYKAGFWCEGGIYSPCSENAIEFWRSNNKNKYMEIITRQDFTKIKLMFPGLGVQVMR